MLQKKITWFTFVISWERLNKATAPMSHLKYRDYYSMVRSPEQVGPDITI
jgi:hypothetical protein